MCVSIERLREMKNEGKQCERVYTKNPKLLSNVTRTLRITSFDEIYIRLNTDCLVQMRAAL